MREKWLKTENEKKSLHSILHESKKNLDDFVEMKKNYKELQQAHVEQTKNMRKINDKYSKIESYVETIKVQEEIINKLQKTIEKKINFKTTPIINNDNNNDDINNKNNGKVENQIKEYEKKVFFNSFVLYIFKDLFINLFQLVIFFYFFFFIDDLLIAIYIIFKFILF
jgi:DNA repair ATPase RecN